MSLFARLNFSRYTTLLCSTKKYSKWTVEKTKQFPLCVMLPVGFCVADDGFHNKHFKEIQIPDRPLTHRHLIQQACSESVHTATRLLTQTLVAIKDIGKLYRESMEDLINLLNESLQRTKNNIDVNDLNDSLVATRSRVEELNKSIIQLTSLMEYVEKLVKSTADTAFIAGADTVCNAMCERLQFAQNELSEDKVKNKKLEEEYLMLQKHLIESEMKENGDKNKQEENSENLDKK
ncbi:uncharacterized protein LOC142331751 [Lycorma delicatula]|uniref:uncharacterized protein LOC142331751 n=1 Tax=Lycorma delicatula TaxID=130591 RepID=UPI003F5120AF